MKVCTHCKQSKSLDQFNKKQKSKDGFSSYCKECNQLYLKEWNSTHKKQKKENRIQWDKVNQAALKITKKLYKKNNREKINKRERDRKKVDIQFKLACNLRTRLLSAIKRETKIGSAVKDLGCSVKELKIYLESQFYPNSITGEVMSWENYGFYGWHIDHIKPLSKFDLSKTGQFLEACNYKNLQPMWAEENLIKGDKCA